MLRPADDLLQHPAGTGVMAFGPARWADAAVGALRPSHVVSFRSPGSASPVRRGAADAVWLDLVFNDIAEPQAGLTPPSLGAVEALLDLATQWNGRAPLLLSCYAGVSRSPAAAYAVACLRRGPGEEAALAQALRAAAPSATPNPLIVALADAWLGRGGAMIDALRGIGRGADCFEGEAVRWDLAGGRAQSAAAAPSITAVSQACSTAPSTSPV